MDIVTPSLFHLFGFAAPMRDASLSGADSRRTCGKSSVMPFQRRAQRFKGLLAALE
jgi:hypothetical protein